jgi:hypothetical protein
MFNTIVGAGAVGAGAGAASRYGSGSSSDQMMRLLVALAPQHCKKQNNISCTLAQYKHIGTD